MTPIEYQMDIWVDWPYNMDISASMWYLEIYVIQYPKFGTYM